MVAPRRHCRDSDVRRIYRNRSDFGGGGGERGWWSQWWEDSPEVMAVLAGGRVRHNRCLRVKPAFAGSVKFPANIAFAARAAIPAAVVWL